MRFQNIMPFLIYNRYDSCFEAATNSCVFPRNSKHLQSWTKDLEASKEINKKWTGAETFAI